MTKPLINDVKHSELANTIALHDFAKNTYDLKGWVNYTVELFRNYGLEATRMAVSAPSLKSGKMKTYIREVKKLDKVDNATVTSITLQATIHGSDNSHGDDIFTAWLSIRDKYPSCVLVLDNFLAPFDLHIWNQITLNMAAFFQPRYGYGFQRSHTKGPEWYPFGIIGRSGNTKVSDQESDLISCWDHTYHKGKYTTGDLRDIYPLNVLSAAHNKRIVDGKPLFEWIALDPNRGNLTKLADNLWSWWVEESKTEAVRASLKPTGILLCAP